MRSLLRAVLAAAVVALVPLAAPAPARAAGVFVELNPSTVQAGFQVAIRASCGDSLEPAKVSSLAFRDVTVRPSGSYLAATVTIPPDLRPGQYTVRLICPNRETATTLLWVVGMERPTRGPNTGGGALAGDNGRTMIAAGSGVIGLGAALGFMAWRRRRAT